MQALIDFDGWRKWKDFSSSQASKSPTPNPNANFGAGTGKSPKSLGLANGKAVIPKKLKKEETLLRFAGKGVVDDREKLGDGSDETTGTEEGGDSEGK